MEGITYKHVLGILSVNILAADILKYKNINEAIIYHCDDSKNAMLLQKAYQSKNIRSQIMHIDKNITYKLLDAYKIGIIVNTTCNLWEGTLSDSKKFKNQFSWILYTEVLTSVTNVLSQKHLGVDSDITVISSHRKQFLLHEVFHTGFNNGGQLVIRNIGYFDSSWCLNIPKRINLSGVVLNFVVVLTENIVNETFQHFLENPKSQSEVDTVHKYKFFTMLTYIRDMYNFSYRLQRTNSWGYVRNGSFEGLVGALQWGSADVGASGVFIRADRARVIDYVAETWPTRPQFFLRQPKYPSGFYSVYTRPLTDIVWYYIIGTLSLISFILIWALRQRIIRADGDEEDNAFTLAFLFIFGAVSQQGMSVNRSSNSIKMITFVTFVFTLTLYQYYNATVVSTLLRDPPKTIKSLEDLLRSNFRAAVEDVIYNKDFFKRTTDQVAKELYKKKIAISAHGNFLKPEDGLPLVKRGEFAYLVDTAVAYYYMRKKFTETQICDTQEVALYPPQSMGAVVKKGLPYKEHFAYGIRKLSESGVMCRLKTMWDEPRPPCVRTPDSGMFSVDIYESLMAPILLLFGVIASIVILLCEIFLHRITAKNVGRRNIFQSTSKF